jgi:hypothetical protein
VIYPVYDWPSDGGQLLGYGCLPNAAGGGATDGGLGCSWNNYDGTGDHPIDCGKLGLCKDPGGVCQCTSMRCTIVANTTGGPLLHFDLTIDGDKATGSVVGLRGSPRVHLTRQ